MKRSLSNNKVLKRSSGSHDIRPFLLDSVNSYTADDGSVLQPDNDSEGIKIEEEAYKRGFTDGINAGRLQILGEIENELRILRTLIEGIERLKEELYRKIEEDVVEISLSIARKIIYEVAEHDREMVVAVAKEAIKRASDREMLKIKISPVDYEILNKKRTELLQCVDGIKSIVFEVDESVRPGGCLIETNQGDVDARIESQIKVVEGEIKSRRGKDVRT